ncbi:MAG: hypothetical protein WC365_09305 [Candidatus Babeliales bacterium]|jgi:hypothetical protein
MSEIIESAKTDNKIIKISIDEFPSDPYNEWDQLSHIVAWHRHYNFGKKEDIEQFKHQEDFEQYVKDLNGKILLLNLYMYEHSGISLSIDQSRPYPFSDKWDSGQIGYAYVTYEEIQKEYSVKRITEKLKQKVIKLIESEIETYNQYLNGQVYQYAIFKIQKCDKEHEHFEIEDSLSGIFGDISDVKEAIAENTDIDIKSLDWQDGDIEED